MVGNGTFVISLDFELLWGTFDQAPSREHTEALLEARRVVPALLELFVEYGIHATWATVGFLFYATREALLRGLPSIRPGYAEPRYSAYAHLAAVGRDEMEDPLHFGASLIEQIQDCPHQEIASHTFSHYCCLEPGQDVETFRADLAAAAEAAAQHGITLESMVFPRSQVNEGYLGAMREARITGYRGTQRAWLHQARRWDRRPAVVRGLRLADAYLPVSKGTCYRLEEAGHAPPFDLRASRFLRPYSARLKSLEPLRLRRISRELTRAARCGQVYHLWWHPWNFGTHTRENLSFLRRVLECFRWLQATEGMESATMAELSRRLLVRRDEVSRTDRVAGRR